MDTALSLTLDERSLAPFRAAWRQAVHTQGNRAAAPLLADVQARMQEIALDRLPPFVRQRLEAVPQVVAMLSDADWQAAADVHSDLGGALAYLTEPNDLIPDDASRYGLLDDALVLELALAAHRQEWLDWHEYSEFRRRHCDGAGLQRQEWLDLRRRLQREARVPRGPYPGTGVALRRERHSYVDGHVAAQRERFKVQ